MTPPATATGGCLCGGVRFEVAEPLGPAAICHCQDCRRITGSAFNVSVAVSAPVFTVTRGAPSAFAAVSDAGSPIVRHFCPDCGSPLWTSSPAYPDRVYVKAGTLDDPDLVRPGAQAWSERRVAWATIPENLPARPRD